MRPKPASGKFQAGDILFFDHVKWRKKGRSPTINYEVEFVAYSPHNDEDFSGKVLSCDTPYGEGGFEIGSTLPSLILMAFTKRRRRKVK